MSEQQPPQLPQDFIDEYSGGRLIGVSVAFIPILMFFVCLRFWSRKWSRTPLGLDDVLVGCSLVFQIGASALPICFVKYGGVGRHFLALEQIDPGRTVVYFKYLLAVSFCYFFGVAIPKLAILALYLRLFTLKLYRRVVYVAAVIVATTGIVCPIMSLNLCHPFAYNWNRTSIVGSCLNEQEFYRWGSLPNIITDVAILCIPMPIVWKLHASKKLKVGLTIAFLTGSLGLATSILRFTSFFHGSALQDGTWASVDLMTWTIVEPDVYIIASCLPTYRPVLFYLIGKLNLVSKLGCSSSSKDAFSHSTQHSSKPRNIGRPGFGGRGSNSVGDDIGLVEVPKDSSRIHVQTDYTVTAETV